MKIDNSLHGSVWGWRTVLILALTLILAGCANGTPVATFAPPATATVVATPSRPPSPTPTRIPPTSTPTPAPPLPAPLYVYGPETQILRLERDGVTVSQITAAETPLTDFDVSSVTGDVAYVADNKLYLGSGASGETRLLFGGAESGPMSLDAPQLRLPRFSPDGSQIAFAYGGVQVIDIASAQARLVQADDPASGYLYSPLSWAPDGKRLLLYRSFFTTDSSLVVLSLADNALIALGDACCHPTWSPDGQYVYVSGPHFDAHNEPGLTRYDTFHEGKREILVRRPEQSDELLLVDYATLLPDGFLYIFQRRISKQAYSEADQHPDFAMVRTAPDGQSDFTRLRRDSYPLRDVLWASDGSGAVIVPESTGASDTLPVLWLPADGSPAITLSVHVRDDYIPLLHWGPINPGTE